MVRYSPIPITCLEGVARGEHEPVAQRFLELLLWPHGQSAQINEVIGDRSIGARLKS